MADENGADVSLKVAGQEVNLRNVKSLNTIATLITMFGVGLLAMVVYNHDSVAQTAQKNVVEATKEANQSIVKALKELNDQNVAALKELTVEQKRATFQLTVSNCMNESAMKNRSDARQFCERIAGR